MHDLQARLIAAGFSDVAFRIINSKLAINGTEGFAILKKMSGDIPVLQEPQDITSSTWQFIMEGGIDHILVLDRCGRLVYQVISPWSLLTYPYVKAAILSTYNDDPCGPCNVTLTEKRNNITETSTTEGTTTSTDKLSNRTHSNATEITLTNKTETIIANNVAETTPAKTESELIIFNNTDSESSDTQTVMESILNATPTVTAKILMLVTQDSAVTGWNESDVQTGQQNFTVNAQKTQKNKHNMSSIQKFNMTGPRDGRIIYEDQVEKMESEHLQNPSAPAHSHQRIHKKSNNYLEQGDNVPETNSLSDTLLPLSEQNDGTVPIRIILHHPHEHHYGNGTVVGYEYVVLQTGNPTYHGHLEETVIPQDETPYKNKKGLDSADADKQTSPRKQKGKKHYKANVSTSGETGDNSESTEEKSAEQTHQHHHKGRKKQKSGERKDSYDTESSTEISQDIRKHGIHQNCTKPSDNNTIHFHREKGRHFHKPGHHEKHKFIQIVVGDNTNGTGSKEGTSKAKGHKQPHISTAEGRNETSEEVIAKSNNQDNSSTTETIKVEIHKKRPTGKIGTYEHQNRMSVTGKLNANQYPNTNTQNASSAQQPLLPLSTVRHRAHRPNGEHSRDDEPHETDSHEQQPVTFRPQQANNPSVEDPPRSSIMTNNSTDTRTDGKDQDVQHLIVHNEHSVKVDDTKKPNVGNTTDAPATSSMEDSSDSDRQGEDIIEHYSKLLKWVDYPL